MLVVLDGRRTSRRYEVKKQEFKVGRDDTCDLVLHDANCSREHAKFTFANIDALDQRPRIILTDLNSRNGSHVNGKLVSTAELVTGDKILLGRTLIGYYLWDDVTLRAEDTLLRSASTDELTGLYNRGFFQSTLTREFHRSVRYGRPLSLIFLDLDHFKQINDNYGHPIGDRVLIDVASMILANSRGNDFACRYGGEEIMLILPETDLDGAAMHASRIREKLKAMEITVGARVLHVTASFGVAELKGGIREPEDLVKMADNAAYRAKREGRDRICTQTTVENDRDLTQPMTQFTER